MFYKNFLINIFYFAYFLLVKSIYSFIITNKIIYILFFIFGVLLKLFMIYQLVSEKKYSFSSLISIPSIIVFILFVLLSTRHYSTFRMEVGDFLVFFIYLIFTLGYFIGLKKANFKNDSKQDKTENI